MNNKKIMNLERTIKEPMAVKDWEETGLLSCAEGEFREDLISSFNIASNIIKEKKLSRDADNVVTYIFPIVRRILHILENSKENDSTGEHSYVYPLHKNQDIIPIIKKNIDWEELINEFFEYYKVFLPICEKYLHSVDACAEMTAMFCYNYVMEKTDKVLKQKKKI